MKQKNGRPDTPEVMARVLERVKRMTPDEALAFLEYRTPGVEMTDMTGMFSKPTKPKHAARVERRPANT